MNAPAHSKGVTLIEVLVALIVISVGLLGIAKMQALAMASTRVSSMRSLIAIEAASLASAMHANRAYWQGAASAAANFSTTVSGSAITASTDASLTAAGVPNCATPGTNPAPPWVGAPMAAYDLSCWGLGLQAVMPSATGTVTCSGASVSCTITVNWQETTVGMNASTQYTNQAPTQLYYALLVQP